MTNIGSLFDRIAGRYDFLNHFLSLNIDRRWRRKAVAALHSSASQQPETPVSVLDVAIGTGDLALEIIRQHKADRVVGLDLSEQMMRIGQAKVDKAGLNERITFCQGSAMDMPFGDNSFDALTCAYGVRNFADLDAGLREMYRVLRPGAQLMILEFSNPTNPLFARIYDLYFTHVLPRIGRLVSGDPTAYSYLNASVKAFVDVQELCRRLKQVGFQHVQFRSLTHGITTVYTASKLV